MSSAGSRCFNLNDLECLALLLPSEVKTQQCLHWDGLIMLADFGRIAPWPVTLLVAFYVMILIMVGPPYGFPPLHPAVPVSEVQAPIPTLPRPTLAGPAPRLTIQLPMFNEDQRRPSRGEINATCLIRLPARQGLRSRCWMIRRDHSGRDRPRAAGERLGPSKCYPIK